MIKPTGRGPPRRRSAPGLARIRLAFIQGPPVDNYLSELEQAHAKAHLKRLIESGHQA